jgi:hypothetical protein
MAPDQYAPLLENIAKEALYSPEEVKTLQALDYQFQQFLAAISGKASTAQEQQNVQRWTAMRGQGIGTMLEALTQMQQFARNKSQALGNPYGQSKPQGGGKVDGVYNPATGRVE